ncbi:tyrosine-type recombinase/integrase [Vibrio europaeus]|uniref:tyrosine-type recombinase/integrase n=1 Tax=Vibrio europaeus TaxID=300876 RepID=UPI0020A4FAF7|nr:tyrosine-type recombinase/integrase [Vibrio europaeus]
MDWYNIWYNQMTATYLLRRSNTYYFRWSYLESDKYKQVKISLRTSDYLKALHISTGLALKIKELVSPCLSEIKTILDEFIGVKKKQSTSIQSIEIDSHISDLSIKSQVEYRSCWNSFATMTKASLTSVSLAHVEAWKDSQTCSPTTLKKKLRLLSSCFNRIGIKHDADWFKLKVTKDVKAPKEALTTNQLSKLLKATETDRKTKDKWKYYLLRIALLTGCRLNEIAQLRGSDIDLSSRKLKIHGENGNRVKNSSSVRNVPINDELYALLIQLSKESQIAPDSRLFDLPWSSTNHFANAPSKFYGKLFKGQGIKGSFHDLRHYVITTLFNWGVKEELIGVLMGHSVGKLTTGKVYLRGFTFDKQMQAMQLLEIA